MKKIISVLLIAVLALTMLSGCKKSDATKNAQELISVAIKDNGFGNENALKAAREAYDRLSDEEKAKVKNYEKLVKAEEEFQTYVNFNEDAAKVIALSEAKFAKAGESFNECIEKADKVLEVYEKLPEARKAEFKDIDKVNAAKAVLIGYRDNAEKAAGQYVKAFNNINAGKNLTVTEIYCIKEIVNGKKAEDGSLPITEKQVFALTYKDAAGEEKTVYEKGRCGNAVTAADFEKNAEASFASAPASKSYDAKESGNIVLDLQRVLALAK